MKKILSLFCAFAISLTAFTTPVLADEEEAPLPEDMFQLGQVSEYGEVPVVSTQDMEEFALSTDADALTASVYSRLPSSFDLRDEGVVPAARNQGSWSTCWAMAATAAAEVNGLYCGLLGTDTDDTNLSERHLIYFMTHQADDPLGNSSGDHNTTMSFWLNGGGNPIVAAMTMASWHGMASEEDTNTPYSGLSTSDSIDTSYAYADALHLENATFLDISSDTGRDTLKQMLLSGGGALLCLYYNSSYLFAGSPSQAALPEETPAPTQSPESTETPDESEQTPEPTQSPEPVETTEPSEPEQSPTQDIAVSQDEEPTSDSEPTQDEEPTPVVSLDGAAQDTEALLVTDGDTQLSDDYTVCYYQDAISEKTNHEVLIVGWDDDYPAENFSYSSQGATPPGNGAWLCRNSYGENWQGMDGYFWVSYYDASVSYESQGLMESARAVVFQFGSSDDYDNNYEYDGAALMGYLTDSIGNLALSTKGAQEYSRRWYGNVFTASGNLGGTELLQAVSTYTYRPSVPYVLTIYTDITDPTDPTSGTLAYTEEGTFSYAGFHTLELDEAITLTYGEQYAVIFQVARDPYNCIFVPACYTLSGWYATNDSEPGQSFVSVDGQAWYDCYDLTKKANVRVKAYTTNGPAVTLPFQDVDADAWYYEDTVLIWVKGLMTGLDETTFAPEDTASRAQAITILHRLANTPLSRYGTTFDDVTKQWYYEAVCWAQEIGLTVGSDDDGDGIYSFRPDDAITREEFVTLLYRYAQALGLDVTQQDDLSDYADADQVDDWAEAAERWSVAVGLQLGSAQEDGQTLLLPGDAITRAQMAAMFLRFSSLLK